MAPFNLQSSFRTNQLHVVMHRTVHHPLIPKKFQICVYFSSPSIFISFFSCSLISYSASSLPSFCFISYFFPVTFFSCFSLSFPSSLSQSYSFSYPLFSLHFIFSPTFFHSTLLALLFCSSFLYLMLQYS